MKYLKQSVQWHITEVCPNRCKHCYIGGISNEERRKNELSIDKLISILDNLKAFEDKYDAELKRFAVTGGDPFEYADFERFLDELSVRGKEINILGIPERVTKENLEMLSKYNVTTYQVSLDGMKNTHDMIRWTIVKPVDTIS